METTGATAICAVLLLSAAAPSIATFYYQSTYQDPLQLQAAYYQPPPLPLPLAYQQLTYYVPAQPASSIYSQPQVPARALLGYSYQMQDLAGGTSQVLYVTGPNSHQLFQENAAALHIFIPEHNISNSQAEIQDTKTEKKEMDALPEMYLRAQVIPTGRALFTRVPSFVSTVNVNPETAKHNDSASAVQEKITDGDEEQSKTSKDDEIKSSTNTTKLEQPESKAEMAPDRMDTTDKVFEEENTTENSQETFTTAVTDKD